jgi:hypothetical protein
MATQQFPAITAFFPKNCNCPPPGGGLSGGTDHGSLSGSVSPYPVATPPKPGCRDKDPHDRSPCDCCKRTEKSVVAAIAQVPGVDFSKMHKPKQKNRDKLERLCKCGATKTSLAPAIFAALARFAAHKQAGNAFEKEVFAAFSSLPADKLQLMRDVANTVRELPPALRDCVFDPKYVNWDADTPLEPKSVMIDLLREGLARDIYRITGGGTNGFGSAKARYRTIVMPESLDHPRPRSLTGPFPLINWVDVSDSPEHKWSRNSATITPPQSDPGYPQPESHEYMQDCQPSNPANQEYVSYTCQPLNRNTQQSPDGFIFMCPGNADYAWSDPAQPFCWQVRQLRAGEPLLLRGQSFCAENVTVRITSQADPAQIWNLATKVIPDLDPAHDTFADYRVNDMVRIEFPTHPPGTDIGRIKPGIYRVQLVVPNTQPLAVTADDGSPPAYPSEFLSNEICVELLPSLDINWSITVDEGFCYDETSPSWAGSDEIWWDAFTSFFKLGKESSFVPNHVEFPRAEWDDMDDGDPVFMNPPVIAAAGNFEVVLVYMLGLEVDDEAVARQQLQKFGETFWFVAGSFLGSLGDHSSEEVQKRGTDIASENLIVTVIVLVLAAAVTAIYAAWASADIVTEDSFLLTSTGLFKLTTNGPTMLPDVANEWRSSDCTLSTKSFPKVPEVPGAANVIQQA